MENQTLNRRILSLALPFLAANISIPLLGLVDTAVLGHLDSEKYLGAIALGGMIFNFLFWGFSFLKMGTTGFTAQARGKEDPSQYSLMLKRGMILALIIGLAVIVFHRPLWMLASVLLRGSPEVISMAQEYYSVRIFSAPAVFMLYVLAGWFLGMQNAVYVLYITILENVSNIIFNLIFIYGFQMRADGVALGTVCAQYLALSFAFSLLFIRYRKQILPHSLKILLQLKEMSHYFAVNGNIMIRTVALMFAFAFFTVTSSSQNDVLLAANMILLQFLLLFSYVTDGLAHAGEALAGYYFGAGQKNMLRLLVRRLFTWSAILAFVFSLIYLLLFRQILGILTGQEPVIDAALEFRWWLVAIPLFSFAAYIWDGIYIGLTASAFLRNAMLLSLLLIFLPLYYLAEPCIGNAALWLAMSAFMASRGVVLWLFWSQLKKKLFN
jgi:multidrug resistance protein, MATE family